MQLLIDFMKRQWLPVLGVAIGIPAGYAYWYFIGCDSGNCPITSSPWMSVLWGGMMGGLILDLFKSKKK